MLDTLLAHSPAGAAKVAADWPRTGAMADIILIRLAGAPATRAELARDLRPLTRPDLAPALWRAAAEPVIASLIEAGEAAETRGRIKATQEGIARASEALGTQVDGETWQSLREGPLTAAALGLDPSSKPVLKALSNADSLRALIVQEAFALGEGRPLPFAKLRAQLAVRALERAFGNQIKSGLGSGTGLSAKPSRVLAGQLSKTPRDYGSDGRLIATLAAEHLGSANAEAETLRLALLRRYFAARLESQAARKPRPAEKASPPQPAVAAVPAPTPAMPSNDRGAAGQRPLPSSRPDLGGFVREVKLAATRRADGWAGNRKAFISHVWEEIKSAYTAWALTEIEFKAMLAEAHRTGGLVLANADLKDKRHMQDFEKSAIQYKNTVWHLSLIHI